MNPTPAERYVDADELAAAMGVSRSTVKRWVRAGAPSETWGMRARRFRISEVAAWARDRAATIDGDQPRLDGSRKASESNRRR